MKASGMTRNGQWILLPALLALAAAIVSPAIALAGSGIEGWRLSDPEDADQEWFKKLEEKLEKSISFDFVDTPLADVAAFLTHQTKVPVVIDPVAVEGDDVPVTLKVSDMRLKHVLCWIVRLVDLDFCIRDEVVFISKPERVFRQIRRIYAVHDLVERDRSASPETSQIPLRTKGEATESLLKFVRGTVNPSSWEDTERSYSSAPGWLSFRYTRQTHSTVEGILAAMRSPAQTQISIRGVLFSAPSEEGGNLPRKLLGETTRLPDLKLPRALSREAVQELTASPGSVQFHLACVNRQAARATTENGHLFEVRPATTDDEVVSVRLGVTFPRGSDTAEGPKAETGKEPQVPEAQASRPEGPGLETTVALRDGEWSLVAVHYGRGSAAIHAVVICATVVKMDQQPKKEVPQQD